MKKYLIIIDTLIKLSIVIILIIAATTRQQYGYYNFLRWFVMILFIYFSYRSYNKKQYGLLIYFGLVAIMFNPLVKFWFQKQTWHLIDYIVAGITIVTIVLDWTLNNKNL